MSTPPPDTLVDLLLEDHRSAEHRLSDLASSSVDSRAELFWKLTDELVRHEVAEEVVLYPVVRKLPGGDQLADARIREQAEAEQQLARMEKLDVASSEFMAEFTYLKESVLTHAQHEEHEVFPLVRAEVPSEDQVQLGQKYQAAKRSAPNHPHPHAPDTPPGNKILGPVAALVDRIRDAANGI
jgi:iron-sulfur cluster repair protein YtfE (RIC family)